ncbi:hypothetical protein CROQUDRAFT_51541 [Cronartium quercuum f. sp. fusiforme G11]|uniref:Peptidase A2 domain-containing protein n=1 Tax=Cronartium quercuum f. sp. fusiforme G11 TaxID=708437 RepID=A0A9P6T7F9_9BASI|nr:hypothetical protein CROQUDRAFT_51541 [Cronartium quercuum f. sp. fusiforme G11]
MNNLYSCPLGYIEVKVGDHGLVRVMLLDSGSQINLMTEKQAKELGLEVQVGIDMKLVGIANNVAKLVGIAEDVPIKIGKHIYGKCHFFITDGDAPLVLGRPFLVDFEAKIEFTEEWGERITILDERGLGLRFSTCNPDTSQFQRELPALGEVEQVHRARRRHDHAGDTDARRMRVEEVKGGSFLV